MPRTSEAGLRSPGLWYGLLAAILAGACVLAATVWIDQRADNRDSRRLVMFWSGYASEGYKQAGDWPGFAAMLEADWPRHEQLGTERLTIWDAADMAQVIAIGKRSSGADAERRIPIMADGRIVGYVSASPSADSVANMAMAAAAIAAALLVGGTWTAAYRRIGSAATESMRAVALRASELAARSATAPSASIADSDADGQSYSTIATGALEQLAVRLQRLETVRRTMVADIAHELRTPLAVMRAQLEQALSAETALHPDKVAALHDETYRMSKLVRDMQELSLAESGRLRLEKRWCAVSELLEGVVDALGLEAEERGVAIRLEMTLKLQVYADPVRLQQIVVNLVGNAIRHARGHVQVMAELPTQDEVRISVSDDGYGIEPEELPQLFERFYRGSEPHRERKEGGLGLGLAIAREYAVAHGGSIEAESRWGEGAAFTVRLPVIHHD